MWLLLLKYLSMYIYIDSRLRQIIWRDKLSFYMYIYLYSDHFVFHKTFRRQQRWQLNVLNLFFPDCPSDWVYNSLDEKCYKFVTSPKLSYEQAIMHCANVSYFHLYSHMVVKVMSKKRVENAKYRPNKPSPFKQ